MTIQKLRPLFSFTQDRLAELQAVLPEAFADGAINWEVLKEALGDYLEDENGDTEHFGLSWPGKREARRLAAMPSKGTLKPAHGEGINEDTTGNIFIEGDNLEVLKLLQKSYAGRIKMIYIDPPYNTGNDFVYKDDFREPLEAYLKRTGVVDEAGKVLTTNTRADGRFHSNWLSMMYPRLRLARQLLRDDGVIFISIDDHEVYNLRLLMNEIFGEESFVCTFIWKRRQLVDNRAKTGVSVDHEYLLVYSKSLVRLRGQEKDAGRYSNPDNDPRGPWASDNLVGLATKEQRPNLHYTLVNLQTGYEYPCPEAGWRYGKPTMARLIEDNKIIWPSSQSGRPRLKRYLYEMADEFTGLSSVLNTAFNTQATRELKELFDGKDIIDFPKPVEYIKLIVQQATKSDENDLVLDFFAGSSTTAQAVSELNRDDDGNRRFILVQLPELTDNPQLPTIAEIGKERIRRFIAKMHQEDEGKLNISTREKPEDLGFKVFKLDRTNYKAWQDYQGENVDEVETFFNKFETPLIEGWTTDNLLIEILLLQGFPLDSTVAREDDFEHNNIVRVHSEACSHHLFVCLDNSIVDDTIEQLHLRTEDIFVCLDSALSDQGKMRLTDICNLSII